MHYRSVAVESKFIYDNTWSCFETWLSVNIKHTISVTQIEQPLLYFQLFMKKCNSLLVINNEKKTTLTRN